MKLTVIIVMSLILLSNVRFTKSKEIDFGYNLEHEQLRIKVELPHTEVTPPIVAHTIITNKENRVIVDEKKNPINRSADHISLGYDLKKFKNNSKYSVQLRLESDSRILSQHRKDIHISLQEKYQCIEGLELTHLDKEDVLLKLNYKTKLSQIKVKIEKEGKQIGCASSNGEMNHVDIIIGEGDYLLNVYQYSSTQGWGQVESIFYNQK